MPILRRMAPFILSGSRPLLAAALAVLLPLGLGPLRAQETQAPQDVPKLHSAPKLQDRLGAPPVQKKPEEPKADRLTILSDLYGRLGAAENEESAGLIAAAIEQLWRKSGSDTVDLLMARAMKLLHEEDFEIALKLLDSVVDIAPDFAEGWNQRATVHFLKGELERSMEDLRHVLVLDPKHFKAITGLALILQKLGNKPGALKAFRKVLKIHPHLTDAQQAERELTREVEGQGI